MSASSTARTMRLRAAGLASHAHSRHWLLGDGWTLMEIAVLVAILACFQNDDPQLFVDGRFEGEGDQRTLVVPGGVGADLRMRGKIAGSPVENGGSGFVRVKAALTVLKRNKWFEVEQTVGELRIRLGERARKLNEGTNA